MERDKQTTVAFVLSGGASLGAIQVGMLRALYERDITPDLIVGTSAGALNDIERHRADTHLIVLPPPCPLNIQPIDFGHADELIDRALLDARQFLDSGGEK